MDEVDQSYFAFIVSDIDEHEGVCCVEELVVFDVGGDKGIYLCTCGVWY